MRKIFSIVQVDMKTTRRCENTPGPDYKGGLVIEDRIKQSGVRYIIRAYLEGPESGTVKIRDYVLSIDKRIVAHTMTSRLYRAFVG